MSGRALATGFAKGAGYGLRTAGLAVILAIAVQAQTAVQVSFAATSAHVAQPGIPVSINLLRWSTEDERAPVVAALNLPSPSPPQAPRGGRAGRGGRGGRGRGDDSAPLTPVAALTEAIGKATTIGYVWTDEVTGYAIKYAWHAPTAAGGERIVLATSRVLGAQSPQWAPAGSGSPTEYEFTLIELRLNAKGVGEGKTSLTTKVIVDDRAETIALENYAAAPVMLQVGK